MRRSRAPGAAAAGERRDGGGGTGNVPGDACGEDGAPWVTSGTPAVTLTVDAASPGAAWNRFYEGAVATDHANTILTAAWGRNAADALKKGHDQAGFRYARFHGILNRDIGVYPDVAPALATDTPDYHWERFNQVYDAIMAAGMRPIVEISFTPPALASNSDAAPDAALVQRRVAQHQRADDRDPDAGERRPGITGTSSWRTSSATWKTVTAPRRCATTGTSRSGTRRPGCTAGAAGYNELYYNTALGLIQGDPA